MSGTEPHFEPIPIKYCFTGVLCSLFCFQYVHKHLSTNSKSKTWEWNNIFVSFLHAAFAGIWTIIW